jgi:hypothetical protein
MKLANFKIGIMGTVEFDGQTAGMRKPQRFIVYPMQDSGTQITVQSDHRIGRIDVATGRGVMSAHRAQYANFGWLAICLGQKTAIPVQVEPAELETLRRWVKASGGVEVGASFVKSDNTGALAIP